MTGLDEYSRTLRVPAGAYTDKGKSMSPFKQMSPTRRSGRWGLLAVALMLSACSNLSQQAAHPAQAVLTAAPAPKAVSTLGTQWGEGRESRVYSVQAQRIEPQRDELQLAYSDEHSIRQALGRRFDTQRTILLDKGNVELSVQDARGTPWPIYSSLGQSNYQLAGKAGERYVLIYTNHSNMAYEVITTVDGLDVLSGKPGSRSQNGYMLQAGAVLRIEGFRKSADEVAAFRFSGQDRAYAANSLAGDARNIGVIGLVLYEVRTSAPGRPASGVPDPFPGETDNSKYAAPPRY